MKGVETAANPSETGSPRDTPKEGVGAGGGSGTPMPNKKFALRGPRGRNAGKNTGAYSRVPNKHGAEIGPGMARRWPVMAQSGLGEGPETT
jgi:hypothetical protein